jgi:hypothetical protein
MTIKEIYDGFEGNTLSDIWSKTKFEKGAIEFQSAVVRKGKKALKITIHKGDKIEENNGNFNTTERDELLEDKKLGPLEEKSYSYSFSLYLPKEFIIVPTRLVLAQWKQNDENNNVLVDNPILALRYVNGELFITLQTNENRNKLFITKEEIRGKWIDFKFDLKFTRTKSGYIRIWMNEKNIVDYDGVTAYSEKYGYPKPGKFYFKMGLYRDTMDEPMTAYFDEFRKNILVKN